MAISPSLTGSMNWPFAPEWTKRILVGAGSERLVLPNMANSSSMRAIRILSRGQSDLLFINLGKSDVVATQEDFPIFVGSDITMTNGKMATHLALLSPNGETEVWVSLGRGI